MKKIINFVLVCALSLCALSLAGCAVSGIPTTAATTTAQGQATTQATTGVTTNNTTVNTTFKVGLICLHDDSSTYDKNFIESMYRALDQLGIPRSNLELKTGIDESSDCYDAAAELAQTCDIVFADSFGHEDYMIQAAQEFTNVQFCHATGEKAHLVKLDNYANAFAAIYDGRYLAGIAAGMKLNEMIAAGTITAEQAVMGYVGAFPYAEVKSGYTAFYLGAKSVCSSVTMKVRFTSSWYDYDKEYAAAKALIENDNCVLISQHADSMGAPTACEEKNVPNVTYNGTTVSACPNTYVVSSKIDWAPYYVYAIQQVQNNQKVDTDWTGTIATGSVKLDAVGTCAAAGTQAAIDAAIEKIKAGTLHVFDTANFTVGGQHITECMANVDYDDQYKADTQVIVNGYFSESTFRSAPYFELAVDGITLINN